uniref:Uncharacterized protein n=1 Tax=Stomoxys calcitrans TaxID=35570 RepID=A0A1I8QEA2_STOCA
MVESVLKDMPNTESYAPYRTVWKNFLKNYDIHDESEVCFERLMKLMNGFNDIFPKYPKVTAPAEEKEIWRLFDMHGINDFLVKSRAIFSNANTNNIDFASNRDRC